METLKTHRDQEYIQLSEPEEIDRFEIEDIRGERFSFLKELGILDYKETFKVWLRKFPRPIFIICARDDQILSWAYVEEWEDSAKDGEPVYVLRAIETSKNRRGERIGYRLLMLIADMTPGYLITKPITDEARKFFTRNCFLEKDEMDNIPMDLQSHPGYLILPPFRKQKLLDEMDEYFQQDEED